MSDFSLNEFVTSVVSDSSRDSKLLDCIDLDILQKYGISHIIEKLDIFLTSNEDKLRYRSTLLIALLLEKPTVFMDTSSASHVIHLLVIFFCRRLQDLPSILPCLQALTAIVSLYNELLDAKYCDIIDIVQSITRSIHIPSYPQNIRQKAWELINNILSHQSFTQQLQPVGLATVEGVVDSLEGEKDPRCLILGLKAFQSLCREFSSYLGDSITNATNETLTTAAELILDTVSCYFPISFSPPPDDPIGITPEDLTEALKICLCEPLPVAKLALPFFIGQINSEILASRVASLNHITKIIQLHGHAVLRASAAETRRAFVEEDDDEYEELGLSFLQRLSNTLYIIAVNDTSSDILQAAHELVEVVTESIALDQSNSHISDWQTFDETILSRSFAEISNNVESMKARSAWKLCSLIGASGGLVSAAVVTQRFLPLAIEKTEENLSMSRKLVKRSLTAAHKGIQVLPSAAIQEKIMPASLVLLDNLVCCSLPKNVDSSRISTLNCIGEHIPQIMQLLVSYLEPFSEANQEQTAQTSSSVPHCHIDQEVFVSIALSMGVAAELFTRFSTSIHSPQLSF